MIKKFKLLDINIEIILNFRSFKKIFYLDRIKEKKLEFKKFTKLIMCCENF